jgi:uncharacterized protein YuzE
MNNKTIEYDPQVDVLTLYFSDATVEDSDEIEPGVIVDYDAEGHVIGVEILDVSKWVKQTKVVQPNVAPASPLRNSPQNVHQKEDKVRGKEAVIKGRDVTSPSPRGANTAPKEGIVRRESDDPVPSSDKPSKGKKDKPRG